MKKAPKTEIRKTTSKQNRRYYLHQIVARVGFKYDAHKRTIYVPIAYNNSNIYVRELNNSFKYNIQFEIR